jgi:hypothetical protein
MQFVMKLSATLLMRTRLVELYHPNLGIRLRCVISYMPLKFREWHNRLKGQVTPKQAYVALRGPGG